jgi:outer membrane protein assembly factor BamB
VRSGWTIGSTSYWLFLGSQDGFAYGYDADAGGSPLWRTSAPLGDMIIASPSAWFRMYDTDASKPATDVLLVGTRTTTGAARSNLVGLNPASGAELWRFDNLVTTQGGDGKGLGIISSAVSVDYASYTPNTAKRRAYFATRRHVGTPLGSQDTLWCVEFDSTTVTKLWSTNVGDIDSAPTMRNGIVYVGNNDGQLWAINAATGIPVWGVPMSTGDGPVKGFVWIDGPRNRGYFSTSTRVWAVNLATGAEVWSQAIPSPSTVVSTGLTVYVGAGDGQVYELSNAVSGPVSVKAQMVAAGASIGSPTFDIVNGVMYVGSDAGRIYSVAFPLP